MSDEPIFSSDVAFTPTVKAIQSRKGSRPAYAKQEQRGAWPTEITEDLKAFIEAQTSVFLATANAEGQPYIQHRGGPPGFLRVIDDRTLAFADFAGNRQYISLGNLAADARVSLILVDYANRRRLKIFAHAEAKNLANDPKLAEAIATPGYRGRAERAFVLRLDAFDWNCPQHITPRFNAPDVAQAVGTLQRRIAELEAENKILRGS